MRATLRTSTKCAICNKRKEHSTPLCEKHEEEFLESEEASPMRGSKEHPYVDMRLATIHHCYESFIERKGEYKKSKRD